MTQTINEKANPGLEGAKELEVHLEWLDTFTPAALGVLATASGIYTYLGVSTLLDNTGALSVVAAVAYATAVSVGIFVFWSFLLKLLPAMRNAKGYLGLGLAAVIGSLAIVAMSSWLNATALAGSAAVEQHLGKTITEYQTALERANFIAVRAQSLQSDIERSAQDFRNLADQEKSGNLSGKSGTGAIHAVLMQKADELDAISQIVKNKSSIIEDAFQRGNKIITKMQTLKSGDGPVKIRSLKFSEESINLSGVITTLKQVSAAPLVFRAMGDLEKIIRPTLDGSTEATRETQADVISQTQEKIQTVASTLRDAAKEIMDEEPPNDTAYTSISSADAVIIYASNFYPQWAGAIAIDLLPALLVFMLAITHAAIRDGRKETNIEERMTLSELKVAMAAIKHVEKNLDNKNI